MFVKESSWDQLLRKEEKKARMNREKSGLVSITADSKGSSGFIVPNWTEMPNLSGHPLM